MHWIEWECMWVPLPVSLEKEMATHSSILAWRIPMDRGTWWATVHGVAKNWLWLRTSLSLFSQTACLFHYLSLDKNLVLGKQISYLLLFSSVQFSRSVVSNSLRPHELQHSRPPCPSPTPGVHPNPCPSSRWCHPTISSSVVPFSSCPQSFPSSGSLHIRWPEYWSFSFNITPSNEHPGLISFRMDWLDLAVQGTLKSQDKRPLINFLHSKEI